MRYFGRDIKLERSWGQNLLVDRAALEFISNFVDNISDGDCVVEFAAGTGNLTEYLLKRGMNVVAVEMERGVLEVLHRRFANHSGLKIIEMNMMDFSFEKYYIEYGRLIIIGNLPYNLSKLFLFKIFEHSPYLQDAVLMFQYEIARRIVALPGERDWSVLSVFSSMLAKTNIVRILEPDSFMPAPRVRSAIVHFRFYDDIGDRYMLYKRSNRVVREIFNYSRKSLRNIIRSRFGDEKSVSIGRLVDLNKRPQNLTLDDIRNICNEISGSE